jgi:hypothetical protein
MRRHMVLLLACCAWIAPTASSQVTLISTQTPTKILAEIPLRTQWKTSGSVKILEPAQLAAANPKEAAIYNEYGFARSYRQKSLK